MWLGWAGLGVSVNSHRTSSGRGVESTGEPSAAGGRAGMESTIGLRASEQVGGQ